MIVSLDPTFVGNKSRRGHRRHRLGKAQRSCWVRIPARMQACLSTGLLAGCEEAKGLSSAVSDSPLPCILSLFPLHSPSGVKCEVLRRAAYFQGCKKRSPQELVFTRSTVEFDVDDEFMIKVKFVPVFVDETWPSWARLAGFTSDSFHNSAFFVALSAWSAGQEHK